MTLPNIEQVVTVINKVQNSIEVISTSHKQTLESWTSTQDALNNLITLVRRCSERDFEVGSELQQPLSDLQRDLDGTYVECQRYHRTKKKGVLRVSGVLPKWMVGKFLEREYARLRSRIQHIHDNFETAFGRYEKLRDQTSSPAGPSSSSVQPTRRTGSPAPSTIRERIRALKATSITERNIRHADARKVPAPSSTVSFSIPPSGGAELYLESEEWVLEDPSDWAAILTEMRSNVQSRATSLLGNGPMIAQPPGPKGGHPSSRSNLMLELKRLEIHLLMQTSSFTPPDLCPPHEYFHAVKLTPSYPIVLSGHSWEVAIRHITDLFNAVDVSSIETRSPEAALALFELSQTLEDLGMHHYSHTVATWAVFLRRRLYNSDKEMHRRDLASTLCLKARVLAGLGRTNGSLIAASEAVKLCYEDQALQGVQLAKALLVQAPLLNAVGRKSEAKVVAREALSILGTLGEDKPQLKHFLSLARASLSNLLLDMEEHDEALAVVQDAIKSARSLIGFTDPRPAHSNALLIKAKIQTARGEKGSAYVTVVQAIRHLRSLTTERPAFTAFLAYALVLSSRYLQVAGFYWEARKSAEESVELHRTLHTSAPRAFAAHYAEAVGQLVRLRSTDDTPETEVFDMAQHAAGLFREASVRDSEGLAGALLVIANSLFEASRPQDAAAPAEEAVEIFRPRWKRNAEEYAVRFVLALRLAAACRPDSEAGLEFAKEAVEAHRPRKDMTRDVHEELLTHLLMDVFSRLRQLGREVEAIPWKTEAARLNPDVVEVIDPPPVAGASTEYPKSLPGGMGEYGSGSDDDELEDN